MEQKLKKKKMVMVLVSVMIFTIGIVAGSFINYNSNSVFNTLEEAKDYAVIQSNQRDNYKDNLKIEYIYTTDKICLFDYEYQDFHCKICYSVTSPIVYEDCTSLPTKSTIELDDSMVRNSIKNIIMENYLSDEIVFIPRDDTGRIVK